MMSLNSGIYFGLQIVFVCLYLTASHYHHFANFIWRHWTYKMPVRYNLSSTWIRLSIFSQLSIIQYVGLCVFSLSIAFVMIESIYILCLIIIIKSVWTITHCLGLGHETMVCAVHQIGSMNYYPLFRVRSWNNDMRCMSVYILIHNLHWWDMEYVIQNKAVFAHLCFYFCDTDNDNQESMLNTNVTSQLLILYCEGNWITSVPYLLTNWYLWDMVAIFKE